MEDGEHPLLSSIEDEFHNLPHDSQVPDIASYDEEDPVGSNKLIPYFFREFYEESKKLWYLAAPAILTTVCQYSLGAITQVFAGHLGTAELATFSVENSIIAGFGYGFMVHYLTSNYSCSTSNFLETWYVTVLILFAGYLKNTEVSVGASGICANIMGWTLNMAGFGLNAAVSVRVSNELGASHPRAAKFSAVVVVITSFLIGLFLGLILIITAKQYPSWFSTDDEVIEIVYKLTPLLVICIVVLNVQLPLAGTYSNDSILWGSHWGRVASLCGICELGMLLFGWNSSVFAYGFHVQHGQYFYLVCEMQASIAGDRLKHWGGDAGENQI
ncbi:hypothetical protein RHSIM_Rhsim12G0111300 [Rhododendron simsii]|uniref:Uncharacterized protein n=1 Tax=Rhododendron simsii TaxID=118357 RepID=A0A834G1A5_RHOSS|nr:hypothetical protein RHSIM_Rhsim12G0111300 [Rhododendron simsii]